MGFVAIGAESTAIILLSLIITRIFCYHKFEFLLPPTGGKPGTLAATLNDLAVHKVFQLIAEKMVYTFKVFFFCIPPRRCCLVFGV